MQGQPEKAQNVVIVGGGFGGLYTALALAQRKNHPPVLLIEPNDRFLFLPLLYELLSGELRGWEIAPRYDGLLAGRGLAQRPRAGPAGRGPWHKPPHTCLVLPQRTHAAPHDAHRHTPARRAVLTEEGTPARTSEAKGLGLVCAKMEEEDESEDDSEGESEEEHEEGGDDEPEDFEEGDE